MLLCTAYIVEYFIADIHVLTLKEKIRLQIILIIISGFSRDIQPRHGF